MTVYKIDGKNVQAVVPWKAKGPGWSNAGVTIYFNNPTGSYVGYEPKTVYEKDLPDGAYVMFDSAVSLYDALARSVMKKLKAERFDL